MTHVKCSSLMILLSLPHNMICEGIQNHCNVSCEVISGYPFKVLNNWTSRLKVLWLVLLCDVGMSFYELQIKLLDSYLYLIATILLNVFGQIDNKLTSIVMRKMRSWGRGCVIPFYVKTLFLGCRNWKITTLFLPFFHMYICLKGSKGCVSTFNSALFHLVKVKGKPLSKSGNMKHHILFMVFCLVVVEVQGITCIYMHMGQSLRNRTPFEIV